ncbi:MAG: competence/damage-inducible protein A, partial [Bacteroides sp.]
MTVELISVGTEILMGNIVNTNAAYLSAGCAQLGLSMYNQQVVGDNPERLAKAIEEALSRADIIIISGGLGPTEDDLTKETAAGVLGMELIEDEHTKKRIKEMLQNSIFKNDIPDNNWKQAMVPEGAVVIDNSNGTAPGLIMEKDGKSVILLPGPPNELEPMFDNDIRPYLAGKNPDVIFSKMVKICGVGESQVETKLLDLIDAQTNPTIATYAKTGEVQVRVTAKASSESAAKELVKPVVKEIKSRFKENVYSVDANETLEEVVVKMLAKKDLKLVTVESCTGGLLAGRIVNVSGASEVFSQGLVTYSNKSKRKVLNVDKAVLKKY